MERVIESDALLLIERLMLRESDIERDILLLMLCDRLIDFDWEAEIERLRDIDMDLETLPLGQGMFYLLS